LTATGNFTVVERQIFGISSGSDSQSAKKAPVGKALRAGLIELTDYLSCVMVEEDNRLAEYDAKDKRRRANTKDTLILD
jgi:curli biogenesis system outer membrane secretion channel CsgG